MVTFVYADPPEPCWRFYGEALALPLVLDQGGCRIYRVAGDAFLGVCRARPHDAPDPAARDRRRGAVLTLVARDAAAVAAWAETLAARGVALESQPTYSAAYDIDHFYVRDPAGYLVEIQAFRSPAWPRAM
jgi:catechol 2,3-dioxygenase-like lactoylglutathione lyase family enzyme